MRFDVAAILITKREALEALSESAASAAQQIRLVDDFPETGRAVVDNARVAPCVRVAGCMDAHFAEEAFDVFLMVKSIGLR